MSRRARRICQLSIAALSALERALRACADRAAPRLLKSVRRELRAREGEDVMSIRRRAHPATNGAKSPPNTKNVGRYGKEPVKRDRDAERERLRELARAAKAVAA